MDAVVLLAKVCLGFIIKIISSKRHACNNLSILNWPQELEKEIPFDINGILAHLKVALNLQKSVAEWSAPCLCVYRIVHMVAKHGAQHVPPSVGVTI